MVDFGDELMIQSHRIPWLIWIQTLVFFLLLLLLYVFGVFASDLTESCSASSTPGFSLSTDSSSEKPIRFPHDCLLTARRAHCSQAGRTQSVKGEIASNTTERRIVRGGEDFGEDEGASTKDSRRVSHHHPCHFIGFARSLFLRCLGLDNAAGNRQDSESKKER